MIDSGAKFRSLSIRAFRSTSHSLSNQNSNKKCKPGDLFLLCNDRTVTPWSGYRYRGTGSIRIASGWRCIYCLGLQQRMRGSFLVPEDRSPLLLLNFLSCFSITWTESSTLSNADFLEDPPSRDPPQPILLFELFLWMEWNLAVCFFFFALVTMKSRSEKCRLSCWLINLYVICWCNQVVRCLQFLSGDTQLKRKPIEWKWKKRKVSIRRVRRSELLQSS